MSAGSGSKDDDKRFADSGYVDSGAIFASADVDELDDLDEEEQQQQQRQQQREESPPSERDVKEALDSGVVESFDDLKLDSPTEAETENETQSLQPWQIYFRQDEEGNTQLHVAIAGGLYEAFLALVHMCPHPALLDLRNDGGRAPIHLAVVTRQPHVARRLLIAGAQVNTRDAAGNTALHIASMNGDVPSLRALMAPLAPPPPKHARAVRTLPQALDQKNYDGETCVHLAAVRGYVDVLHHLVWFGADVNARENKGGRTALHLAIECGQLKVIEYLLERCSTVSLEARTYAGRTALQSASAAMKARLLAGGHFPHSHPDDDDEYTSDEDDSDDEDDDEDNDNFTNVNHFHTREAINVA